MILVPVRGGGHDSEVSSPMSAGPPEALVAETTVISLERSVNEGIFMELELNLVAIGENPPCEVLVIIFVQSIHEEGLEIFILENAGSEERCASGQGGERAIHVLSSTSVEVASFEIANAENVADRGHAEVTVAKIGHTLLWTSCTDHRIFEACKHCRQEVETREDNVIITKAENVVSAGLVKALQMVKCGLHL